MGIVGQRRLQSVRADSRRKRKLGKIRQRNCVFDLLALRAEREGAEVSGDPNRKSAVRAVALIVAAELIERRETKWPDADAVFRRSIVAGDPTSWRSSAWSVWRLGYRRMAAAPSSPDTPRMPPLPCCFSYMGRGFHPRNVHEAVIGPHAWDRGLREPKSASQSRIAIAKAKSSSLSSANRSSMSR